MKKLSTTKQILNILNTQGGKKPKQLIALTKASSASVYNALHQLRRKKMIAKEDDGVYISQTQKSASKVTNKAKPMPLHNEKASKWTTVTVSTSDKPTLIKENILKENMQLTEWAQMWKRKCEKLEADYTQAKIMYLDSQAVVKYLEEKVAQLIKG